MKKILLAVALLLTMAPFCRAQDTVQYMDPDYLFNERHPYTVFPTTWGVPVWGSWDNICSHTYSSYHYDVCGILPYVYPLSSQQEPVTVYGIALTVTGRDDVEIGEDDMSKYPYIVVIGQIIGNTFVDIDSIAWDSLRDSKQWFKYSQIGDGVLYEHVVPVYEFYFDTPHLMEDTFYVGIRRTVSLEEMPYTWFNYIWAIDSSIAIRSTDISTQSFEYSHLWGGQFPIIQPNRRCSVPDAPSWVLYNATNTVRFNIPYLPGDSLLLSIARQGQPVDSGYIYPVTDNAMDIVIPDSGHYSARLARICHRDIDVQSQWSVPSNFFIMNTLGIDPTSVTEPLFSIYPNPAADRVAVRCGGRMTAVEVVDALGRTVLSIDGGGNEAMLDVSALPTGLYTVLVTTPQGRTARHLTIAR